MTLQPHREIFELWGAVARFSFREGAFVQAGPDGDALGDAEQLLCVLYPAAQRPRYRLDVPERTEQEALDALRLVGDRHTVPLRLIRAQTAYLMRYRDDAGRPIFATGKDPESVECFAVGLRLSLVAIGFGRVFRSEVTDAGAVAEARRLEELASVRLTAAMVGLLRSFAVGAFDDDSPAGETLHRLLHQEHRDARAVLAEYRSEMAEARARILEDIKVGSVAPPETRELPYVECGWTWGVVDESLEVEIDMGELVGQRPGTARPVPDLYFTWVALEAIPELWSPRTRVLGLLKDDQQRLARALQLRLEVTRFHWARLAMFGDHRWPVERLPWPGGGGDGDYASLLVAAIAAAEVGSRTGNNDLAFAHLLRVLARLAARHGIVRPPHAAGSPSTVPLAGADLELPAGRHRGADFAVVLFDAVVHAATETGNEQLRTELAELAALVWDHVGGAHVGGTQSAWRDAYRLAVAMTLAGDLEAGRAAAPLGFVHQLLAETDEALEGLTAPAPGLSARLDRARRMVDRHPARAAALLYQILGTLDEELP